MNESNYRGKGNNNLPYCNNSAKNRILLTKESSESEIKQYFTAILKLLEASEEFPVNLEEVWPLVYNRKQEAVRALTNEMSDFIEGVDYKAVRQNAQGGQFASTDYFLTVSCMEFFIARKVRAIFEVYRQVFHKVTQKELSRKELALMIIQAEEEKEHLVIENEKLESQKEQLRLTSEAQEEQLKTQAPQVEYFHRVIDSTGLQTVNMIASCFGISPIKLNKLLCQWGIQYKQSGTYFLYAKYRDKGYAEHKPYPYIDSKGETKTRQHMFWTEKGKQFIIELYTDKAKVERLRKALNEQVIEQSKEREAIQ